MAASQKDASTDTRGVFLPKKPENMISDSKEDYFLALKRHSAKCGNDRASHLCEIYCDFCKQYFCCWKVHNWFEIEDHGPPSKQKNRKIRCGECGKDQLPSRECENCEMSFGTFENNESCLKCLRYANSIDIAESYHCDECGACRSGNTRTNFHCKRCDKCIRGTQELHKCYSVNDCPICLEDLKYTVLDVTTMACGHRIHTKCWNVQEMRKCPKRCTEKIVERDMRYVEESKEPTCFTGIAVKLTNWWNKGSNSSEDSHDDNESESDSYESSDNENSPEENEDNSEISLESPQ